MEVVSLILTTYNSAENLKRTLESIEKQDYPDIEVNIKDGDSSDNTLVIIKEYAKESKYKVNWISNSDKGIYDAMNQGYEMATGEIIVFFNDIFIQNDAVSKMVTLIIQNTECVGAHADLVYASEKRVVRYWKMGKQKSIYWGWMPGHPSLFLKREVYEQYGLYNENYRISADYEFMVRFLKDKNNKLMYLPEIVVKMYYGGTSNLNINSYLLSLAEGHKALKQNGIRIAFVIDILRTCRVLWQFISPVSLKRVRWSDL